MYKKCIILFSLLILFSFLIFSLDSGDFKEVEGYTVKEVTYYDGTFEGAENGDKIELANGMIFEFRDYSTNHCLTPDVVVFEDEKFGVYKLLIDDEFYDVIRIK